MGATPIMKHATCPNDLNLGSHWSLREKEVNDRPWISRREVIPWQAAQGTATLNCDKVVTSDIVDNKPDRVIEGKKEAVWLDPNYAIRDHPWLVIKI